MNSIYEQKIIDTHIHLWDLKKNLYEWIDKSSNANLKKDYLLNNFISDVGKLSVKKAVHIQAEINRNLSLEETRWLQSMADKNSMGFPNAIIGFVDLKKNNCEEELDKHKDYPNFRGIRQMLKYDYRLQNSDKNLLEDDNWINNLKILESKNLIFEILINYFQFKEIINILKKYPNLQFILNHTLWPIDVSENNFSIWRDAVTKLSEFENVTIKISGFGERDPFWDKNNIMPFFNFVLEKFTINRCMLGSNFPVDRAFSEKKYFDYWDAYHTICAEFSKNEKDFLFYKNAENFYKI